MARKPGILQVSEEDEEGDRWARITKGERRQIKSDCEDEGEKAAEGKKGEKMGRRAWNGYK